MRGRSRGRSRRWRETGPGTGPCDATEGPPQPIPTQGFTSPSRRHRATSCGGPRGDLDRIARPIWKSTARKRRVRAPPGCGLFDAILRPRRRAPCPSDSRTRIAIRSSSCTKRIWETRACLSCSLTPLSCDLPRCRGRRRAALCILPVDRRSSPGRSARRLRIAVRNLSRKKRR